METVFTLFVFWMGGMVYQSLELFWRRKTHPSMFLAGGAAAVLIDVLCNGVFMTLPLLLRCLLGGMLITAVEFCFGCVVNLHFGWNVWDYSRFPHNVLGQICVHYSALWCILSLPAILLLELLRRLIVI